jgi:hypothetical protein
VLLDISPRNTPHPGDPKGGVIFVQNILSPEVLSPEEALHIYISVFGKRLSRKSNSVLGETTKKKDTS